MKYKVFYLLFIYTLINFNNAPAFFLMNDPSDEIQIEPGIIDRPIQGNPVFQLYDNFFHTTDNDVLVKKQNGFIAADQVDVHIPLTILARDSISPENSIDRLLLANLRIKNLMAEYKKLQKKARLILLDQTMIPAKTDDGHGHRQEKGESDTIEDEKAILNKKLFNINRLRRLTRDDTQSDEIVFIENYANLKNNTKPSPRSVSYVAGAPAHIDHPPDLASQPINTLRQNFTGQENRELPWVFTFFMAIVNYILTHRVEILLYMLFVCFAGFIFSLYVRRREL